jgi:hypothetical protein
MKQVILTYEEICFVLNCVSGMNVQKDEDDFLLSQQVIKKLKVMKEKAK